MDAIDREILIALQQDGRQTNAHPAEQLGLSASAMHERVRRLERDGLVRGFHADVAPEGLGVGLQAFVTAEINTHSRNLIEGFEKGALGLREARACYHVTGLFDYPLHVAVRDLAHLGRLIKTDIAAIPGVAKLETLLVLTEVKADAGWPAFDDD